MEPSGRALLRSSSLTANPAALHPSDHYFLLHSQTNAEEEFSRAGEPLRHFNLLHSQATLNGAALSSRASLGEQGGSFATQPLADGNFDLGLPDSSGNLVNSRCRLQKEKLERGEGGAGVGGGEGGEKSFVEERERERERERSGRTSMEEEQPLLHVSHLDASSQALTSAAAETFFSQFWHFLVAARNESRGLLKKELSFGALALPLWPVFAVVQWGFFNIVMLLLTNKLYQDYAFSFPLTLTTVHFAISFGAAFLAIEVFKVQPKAEVSPEDRVRWVLPLATATCFNLVLNNLSLHFIPSSFMQTVKAFSPLIVCVQSAVASSKPFEWRLALSLLPVVLGSALATSRNEQSVDYGTAMAALCSCTIGAATVVFAEHVLQGKTNNLDSINALYYMVPYAGLILTPPAVLLEGGSLLLWWAGEPRGSSALGLIFTSGLVAFCLNFALFYTIQTTSAVTFSVASNLKAALTVVLSWLLFQTPLSELSAAGCIATVMGVAIYVSVLWELRQKRYEAIRNGLLPGEDLPGEGVEGYLGAMI